MQITVTFNSLKEMKDFTEQVLVGSAGTSTAAITPEAFVTAAGNKTEEKKETQEGIQEPAMADRELPQNPEKEAPAADHQEREYTLEEVRAKLAALNKAGKRADVKEILSSFGAQKLTEIPADRYAELMRKAGELDA